ncbi:hydantoinase/oxoprolinase family protein [Reyranella sp. CPCC 100927]|uniref:hydantoinase/oxoprolinase family protein n=1 Tax=Reyranella sp. CPCC 100927 TaxID=2599616 RepID=UPI0011B42A19|nr:hydantoinase/oxoprolinase family protein [Reyranella sp. CPCC 100927]TWT15732.1 hydantoinase/oxoprolinase family protein [Reyranella sp. CPCC 100927]
MTCQIAVDVGGTFTDIVLQDGTGRVRTYKAPTTPGRIVDGILDGVELVAADLGLTRKTLLADCAKFTCGTTAATNAILEGTYARTGLICTAGFRDTLLIREGGKQDTYNIAIDYPAPFIPRHLTAAVTERINAEGGIETPLDETSVLAAIDRLKAQGVEAIAVALLWSIANPQHERRIGALLDQHWPDVPYSLSHRTSPTLREYRRTSATAIDASLKPLVRRTVNELEGRLRQAGLAGVLTLVTSSGGQTDVDEVMDRPINLCLSGPSAAPESARSTIRAEGEAACNAVVIDMGGTSFDISIINDWQIPMHREGVIDGHVFGVASVAIKTIGAGGGSIARVDAGGFIHVGPESAKSVPGPACYGRGGMRPTVTDANLARGFLDADNFAGGTMTLARDQSVAAIEAHVAKPLGLSVEEAAGLIGLTVEQNMVAAIEDITIRQGIDPREYVMVAGGAAAGLHVVPMARELGIRKVFVPPVAGVLSAFGILVSDIKSTFSLSAPTATDTFDYDRINTTLATLKAQADSYLDRMKVAADAREIQFSAEARYRGQVWQLSLDVDMAQIPDAAALSTVAEAFHRLHQKLYFVTSTDPIEFTEWTATAIGKLPATAVDHGVQGGAGDARPAKGTRAVFMRELGGRKSIPVIDGTRLRAGAKVEGPAMIDQPLTTIVLYPSTTATMSKNGGVWIDLL